MSSNRRRAACSNARPQYSPTAALPRSTGEPVILAASGLQNSTSSDHSSSARLRSMLFQASIHRAAYVWPSFIVLEPHVLAGGERSRLGRRKTKRHKLDIDNRPAMSRQIAIRLWVTCIAALI